MDPFFILMFVWIICFVASMLLYYFLTRKFPQYWLVNAIIVAIFGFSLAYFIGYILEMQIIMIPLIF